MEQKSLDDVLRDVEQFKDSDLNQYQEIITDTGGIIAFLDRDDRYHSQSVNIIQNYQIYVPVTVLPDISATIKKLVEINS